MLREQSCMLPSSIVTWEEEMTGSNTMTKEFAAHCCSVIASCATAHGIAARFDACACFKLLITINCAQVTPVRAFIHLCIGPVIVRYNVTRLRHVAAAAAAQQ
jgi:hypothetical protein